MSENIVFIIILIIITILACVQYKKSRQESFSNMEHSWANSGMYYAPFNSQSVTSSSTGNSDLCHWQYNPKSTLTDYHYYKNNDDLSYYEKKNNMRSSNFADNRKTLQLAPISNSQNDPNAYSNCIMQDNQPGEETETTDNYINEFKL